MIINGNGIYQVQLQTRRLEEGNNHPKVLNYFEKDTTIWIKIRLQEEVDMTNTKVQTIEINSDRAINMKPYKELPVTKTL